MEDESNVEEGTAPLDPEMDEAVPTADDQAEPESVQPEPSPDDAAPEEPLDGESRAFDAAVAETDEEKPAEPKDKKPRPSWVKKAGIAVVAVVCLGFLFRSAYHDWSPATCTEPQVCTICGRTKGEPLGHDYAEATCTEPETCKRCGATEGEALGHDVPDGEWVIDVQPTCTKEGSAHGVCKRCGKEQTKVVEKAQHTEGEPQITIEAGIDASGKPVAGEKTYYCTVCGAAIRSEDYTLSAEEIAEQFKGSCESPSYDDVARNPDDWKGKKVTFRGKVIQVMQDGDDYTLRVNVTEQRYYWSDTILVSYSASDGASRILEDDIVTLYGVMKGMYSYTSVLGATITVPLMLATYVG